MQGVSDERRELVDYIGVANILLLCRRGQDQVISNEPGDNPRFVLAEPVLEAKGFGIDRAQFRMVATSPLGNIMK